MSSAKKALLYWNTLRYLKPIQIYRRFWFRYYQPSLNCDLPKIHLSKPKGIWQRPVAHGQSLIDKNTFCFLNQTQEIIGGNGWNDPKMPKLWLYNLHYFDDLNAQKASDRLEWHHQLISRWVEENPPTQGNGWESYPSSLRMVNWIKWALAGNKLGTAEIESLYLQARWLTSRVEWHLLGNHLLANAKALIFAGTFFDGDEPQGWLSLGKRIFEKQIPEQILADGVHFERSPMYHAIILEDVLDLVNLAQTFPDRLSAHFLASMKAIAKTMLMAFETLNHPDGKISFFNDAAFGIAGSLSQLDSYAQSLGIDTKKMGIERQQSNGLSLAHLHKAGYIRLENSEVCALLDVAEVGPDYLPGHAHADTLSFELSIFGERLIVNGGTSTYAGALRPYERSTKAHSTVEIDGKDSSEVWGHFRVANRAEPVDLSVANTKQGFEISCAHNGYQRLISGLIHGRTWNMSAKALVVSDRVYRDEVKNAKTLPRSVARYILHPSVRISLVNINHWELQLPTQGLVQFIVHTGNAYLEKSTYSPEFGISQETQCVVVELVGDSALSSQVQLDWG
ncbi:alginate lyase family protein [Polynucleobacter sp.]|uniref:heparinase II/III family protein n=1 Tax=Polynucleobacter sp. TaxID=2029855 RepID=UPI0026302E70|nr:alginate lyase family protein [Polynucleobacter sp.]MCW1965876.1 heparinase II/III family protein [Polynucleobacter sp.]